MSTVALCSNLTASSLWNTPHEHLGSSYHRPPGPCVYDPGTRGSCCQALAHSHALQVKGCSCCTYTSPKALLNIILTTKLSIASHLTLTIKFPFLNATLPPAKAAADKNHALLCMIKDMSIQLSSMQSSCAAVCGLCICVASTAGRTFWT